MIAIFKREMKAYFYSPIGYIFIGFFMALSGWFFTMNNLANQTSSTGALFGNLSIIFVFLVPILTMRLLAEEQRTKTDQLLLTSPISITEIVTGKFLAAVGVYVIALLLTIIFPVILFMTSKPSITEILGAYVGLFLMGACFIAIGLFISSLTENQVIAAVASLGTLLILYLAKGITAMIQNPILVKVVNWLSIVDRYDNFLRGLFSLDAIVYYLTFIIVFLFAAARIIEKRRWS